jgi:hypothetical protein
MPAHPNGSGQRAASVLTKPRLRLLVRHRSSCARSGPPLLVPRCDGARARRWAHRRFSGVPFTFFRPTYFTDNLPRHVRAASRSCSAAGSGCCDRSPWTTSPAWSRAPCGRSRRPTATLYVHGREPITLADPLQLPCAIVAPGTRLVSFRAPMMRLRISVARGGRLRGGLGDHGGARAARRARRRCTPTARLGAPSTTCGRGVRNAPPDAKPADQASCSAPAGDASSNARSPPVRR